jgi:hypothetical protein
LHIIHQPCLSVAATVAAAAAACRPQLNSLTCCSIYSKGSDSLLPIDDEAAAQLAFATQLTSLVLCDCELQDSAVNTIAASLKRLKKLKLDCNPGDRCIGLDIRAGWGGCLA